MCHARPVSYAIAALFLVASGVFAGGRHNRLMR